MQNFVILIVLLILEIIYFKIANHYNIIDKPNHRSSHTKITLRGGGIIFPIAALLAFAIGYIDPLVALSVMIVSIISFIDDIKPLSTLPRFSAHLLSVLIIFYHLNLFYFEIWIGLIILIFFIGWINAFNFMDGINGITVLYSMVALVSFAYMPIHQEQWPLIKTLMISCLVFGYFNLRKKAVTFAGDVGSISLAILLGFFMLKTIVETKQIAYLLFFSIYGIDAVFTIIHRLLKKENIFKAHRSHLYQYLVNEYGYGHVLVSVVYAIIQLAVNVLVFYLSSLGCLSSITFFVFLCILALIYCSIRIFLLKKMKAIRNSQA